MTLALCAAFRNTPAKLRPLLDSFFDHSRWAPNIYIGVQHDDEDTRRWLADMPVNVVTLCGPPQGSANALERTISVALPTNSHFLVFADDCEMLTPRYDELLADRLSSRAEICFVNDGRKGRDLLCHPIFSRAWIDTLGFAVPDGMRHYYSDTWVEATARYASALRYFEDITMRHHIAGNDDPEYIAHKRSLMDDDRRVYLRGHEQRKLDAQKIRQYNANHD